ncbi:MAG TPA: putative sugar nucleotidyl transferase [Gemmatimonadaceae bacterium]|nr:putative sugar nucleotidyl transferase [Gemmatimonadaceae bacterium]
MSAFYLYDDARARQFEPFALTRPVGELRAGAMLVRERWEQVLGMSCRGSVSSEQLADFDEPGAAPVVGGELPAGALLVNARALPALGTGPVASAARLLVGGRLAAVRLAHSTSMESLRRGQTALDAVVAESDHTMELAGRWIEEVWDLVATIDELLPEDIPAVAARRGTPAVRPEGCAFLGDTHAVYAEAGAIIEPFVTFDLSTGPVYLEQGATLQSFTRVQGPCWIGRGSIVGSDRVSSIIVGETCKVHGEVSHTVFLAYCNKGHDGFVGHSYLGRWVNLGANTVTSNLKNTYSSVDLWTPTGVRDTGLQFLGTLFGDHAKTGIGLKLTTGSVLGAGAQVYGMQMPPKAVPPFAWGEKPPYQVFRLDKFLEVAERVMARRKVELSAKGRRQLSAAHGARWSVGG